MRYFVSGHRDLTREEFEEHYAPLIKKVIEYDEWPSFIVGDWEGCDTLFVEHLILEGYLVPFIVTYTDKLRTEKLINRFNKECILAKSEQLNTYDECDTYMTKNSDFDIAWIRPGREDSHTAKNIKRRYEGNIS